MCTKDIHIYISVIRIKQNKNIDMHYVYVRHAG